MQESPSGAKTSSASTEIPCTLRNPRAHNRAHKSPPLVPVLRQINPLHALLPTLPLEYPSHYYPHTPRSSKWSPSTDFSTTTLYAPLVQAIHTQACYHVLQNNSSSLVPPKTSFSSVLLCKSSSLFGFSLRF